MYVYIYTNIEIDRDREKVSAAGQAFVWHRMAEKESDGITLLCARENTQNRSSTVYIGFRGAGALGF